MMVSHFLGTSIVKKRIYHFLSMKVHWFNCADVKGLIEKLGSSLRVFLKIFFFNLEKAKVPVDELFII